MKKAHKDVTNPKKPTVINDVAKSFGLKDKVTSIKVKPVERK